jgi:hypothetical protein
MRTVLFLIVFTTACRADAIFGTWKMDVGQSKVMGSAPSKSLTVRIEPHAKGEVFTLDRIEADGRSISSSTILYFDGAPHDFQDFECSGTQSSRRVDSRTLEIVRTCASGGSSKIVRRLAVNSKELTFDITEYQPDGRAFEQRLVLEKQSAVANSMNGQQR